MSAHENAYQRQDGQILGGPHPIHTWRQRCPDGWAHYDIKVAWREAESIALPTLNDGEYARYHAPTAMILIGKWGFLATAIPLADYDESIQQYVRTQVGEP